MAHAVGFIPARYGSTRFPGKPLASLEGKPLIQHVWERAARARRLDRVVVATDDERIHAAVSSFGGVAMMTSPDHHSGTDRIAEAVRRMEEQGESVAIALNIQGDEVMLDPAALDGLVESFDADPDLGYATLAEPFGSVEDLLDPNTCKVVLDASDHALYFSRSPIPFLRVTGPGGLEAFATAVASRSGALSAFRRHVGIYAFRRDALMEFARTPAGRLELTEGLEQLRILEAGWRLKVVTSSHVTMDVDTPEDLDKIKALLGTQRLHA